MQTWLSGNNLIKRIFLTISRKIEFIRAWWQRFGNTFHYSNKELTDFSSVSSFSLIKINILCTFEGIRSSFRELADSIICANIIVALCFDRRERIAPFIILFFCYFAIFVSFALLVPIFEIAHQMPTFFVLICAKTNSALNIGDGQSINNWRDIHYYDLWLNYDII